MAVKTNNSNKPLTVLQRANQIAAKHGVSNCFSLEGDFCRVNAPAFTSREVLLAISTDLRREIIRLEGLGIKGNILDAFETFAKTILIREHW
jgi:hypothetical protein